MNQRCISSQARVMIVSSRYTVMNSAKYGNLDGKVILPTDGRARELGSNQLLWLFFATFSANLLDSDPAGDPVRPSLPAKSERGGHAPSYPSVQPFRAARALRFQNAHDVVLEAKVTR